MSCNSILDLCVLYGKTTTDDQFQTFSDSLNKALIYSEDEIKRKFEKVIISIYSDREEAYYRPILEVYPDIVEFRCIKKDAEPGSLRNSFLSYMIASPIHNDNCIFTFFDGDDFIDLRYFDNLDVEGIRTHGWSLCSPIAYYDKDISNQYYLNWIQNYVSREDGDVRPAVFSDDIGCQCWGKFYSYKVCFYTKFGKGLFEDVPFMYRVAFNFSYPVISPKSVYYWRRNNPNSITRTSSTEGQIREGINNLKDAMIIADMRCDEDTNHYEYIEKRATTGAITLLRNANKNCSDKFDELKDIILEELGDYINPFRVRDSEPDLWRVASKELDLEEIFDDWR